MREGSGEEAKRVSRVLMELTGSGKEWRDGKAGIGGRGSQGKGVRKMWSCAPSGRVLCSFLRGVELQSLREGVVLLVMRGVELRAITEIVVLLVMRGVELRSIREGVVIFAWRGVELWPGNEGVELLLPGVTHLSG